MPRYFFLSELLPDSMGWVSCFIADGLARLVNPLTVSIFPQFSWLFMVSDLVGNIIRLVIVFHSLTRGTDAQLLLIVQLRFFSHFMSEYAYLHVRVGLISRRHAILVNVL